MKRLLFILFAWCGLFSVSAQETNIVLYSTETTLGNQAGWVWWYGDDICPSGMARQISSSPSISATGTIPLPLTLIPGSYNAYIKVHVRNNAGNSNLVVGLTAPGGTTLEKIADDRDPNTYWTVMGALNVPSATTSLTFNWRTLDATMLKDKACSMIALYLTTVTNIIVTPDDYVQRWMVPLATDTSPPIPGNLLPNSSFEMGLDGWTLFPNTKVFYSPRDVVITGDAADGSQAIAFPNLPLNNTASSMLEVTTMPILVRPNKAHTFSWWAKSIPAGGKVRGKISPAVLTNANLGLPPQTNYQSATFTLTTNWTRYSAANMILRDYPAPAQYYVELEFDPTGVGAGTTVYFDALQLEEGTTASTYAPAYAHEAGIQQTQPGGSYYIEDNNSTIDVVVSGIPSLTETLTLVYQISNRLFTNLITYTNAIAFGPGRTIVHVDCNSLPLGPFRIAAWLSNGSESEGYFSRIHRPQNLERGQGIFGNHMEQWWGNMQLAKRRGYTVSRVFSPAGRFRWEFIEPTQDTFSYGDSTLEMIAQEIEPFCTLYQKRAGWANRTFIKTGTPSGSGFIIGEVVTQDPAGVPKNGLVTWVGTASDPAGPSLQVISADVFNTTSGIITGGTSASTASPTLVRFNTPSIDRYTNYVAHMVGHFTNKFIGYEVMNEPNLDTEVSGPAAGPKEYNFYAQVLRDSVRAAKAVYPEVKLVGISGVNLTNDWGVIWNLLPEETRTNLFATSIHLYEGNSFRNEDFVKLSKANNGPEVWMTEGGVFNFSQYYGCRAAWRNYGLPLLPFRDSEDFMRTWNEALELGPWNMIEAIGGGVSRHFYYGNQYYHHYGDPTAYSVQYTGLDLQEVAKPVDVSHSFVMYSLDAGKGLPPRPFVATGSKAYLIQAPGDVPWAFIKDVNTAGTSAFPTRTNRVMNWSLANGVQVQAYSVLGNALPFTGTTLKYNMIPIMIKGINGTTMTQMSNALVSASFSVEADITPPVITICDYPKGPVGALHNHRLRVRWLVYDEFYTTRMNFGAVNTRYKVDDQPFTVWDQFSFTEYPQEATMRTAPQPRLTPGGHVFTVEARDVAGNTSTNSVSVTIL